MTGALTEMPRGKKEKGRQEEMGRGQDRRTEMAEDGDGWGR